MIFIKKWRNVVIITLSAIFALSCVFLPQIISNTTDARYLGSIYNTKDSLTFEGQAPSFSMVNKLQVFEYDYYAIDLSGSPVFTESDYDNAMSRVLSGLDEFKALGLFPANIDITQKNAASSPTPYYKPNRENIQTSLTYWSVVFVTADLWMRVLMDNDSGKIISLFVYSVTLLDVSASAVEIPVLWADYLGVTLYESHTNSSVEYEKQIQLEIREPDSPLWNIGTTNCIFKQDTDSVSFSINLELFTIEYGHIPADPYILF